MPKYTQGFFKPKNPSKYKGDPSNIVYRSSWELSVMMRLDHDSKVIQWSSEEVVVGYKHPVDGRKHRYFIDFWCKKQIGDRVETFLIEVKPKAQTLPPKMPKSGSKSKTYISQAVTYAINQAKWEAAREYAKGKGWLFEVWTEANGGVLIT